MALGGLIIIAALSLAADGQTSGACMQSLNLVAAGAPVTAANFEPASCSARQARAFRYDPVARAPRTLRQLQPGEVVEALPASLLPTVRAGDTLTVSTSVGPVRIDRQVEALQAAHPGERLFVRAADGAVFSAQLPEARP